MQALRFSPRVTEEFALGLIEQYVRMVSKWYHLMQMIFFLNRTVELKELDCQLPLSSTAASKALSHCSHLRRISLQVQQIYMLFFLIMDPLITDYTTTTPQLKQEREHVFAISHSQNMALWGLARTVLADCYCL